MSNLNEVMAAGVKSLVKGADIHKETGAVVFKPLDFPKDITSESLSKHVDFINQTSVMTGVALGQIANEQYPDSKLVKWTGELEMMDSLTISSGYQIQEKVGEETLYGISEVFVDFEHGQELTDWHSEFSEVNAERAEALFK